MALSHRSKSAARSRRRRSRAGRRRRSAAPIATQTQRSQAGCGTSYGQLACGRLQDGCTVSAARSGQGRRRETVDRAGQPGLEPGIAGFGDRSLEPIWPLPPVCDRTARPVRVCARCRCRSSADVVCEHTFVYRPRSAAKFRDGSHASRTRGLSDYEIGRRLGVASRNGPELARDGLRRRATRLGPPARELLVPSDPRELRVSAGRLPRRWNDLADRRGRSWRLAIFCDSDYPDIIRRSGRGRRRLSARPARFA